MQVVYHPLLFSIGPASDTAAIQRLGVFVLLLLPQIIHTISTIASIHRRDRMVILSMVLPSLLFPPAASAEAAVGSVTLWLETLSYVI